MALEQPLHVRYASVLRRLALAPTLTGEERLLLLVLLPGPVPPPPAAPVPSLPDRT